jgi:hypothetical protein
LTCSFTPSEFIERLITLVPLPKFHLTRYCGVFAKASKYRDKLPDRPPLIAPAKRIRLWGGGQTLEGWERDGFDVSENDTTSNSHSLINGDFYPGSNLLSQFVRKINKTHPHCCAIANALSPVRSANPSMQTIGNFTERS